MTPVRPPSLPAVAPTSPTPRNDARTAAQRAFFEAALGKAPSAPVAAAPAAQTAPAAPRVETAAATEEPAKRFPRPGSILDIRV